MTSQLSKIFSEKDLLPQGDDYNPDVLDAILHISGNMSLLTSLVYRKLPRLPDELVDAVDPYVYKNANRLASGMPPHDFSLPPEVNLYLRTISKEKRWPFLIPNAIYVDNDLSGYGMLRDFKPRTPKTDLQIPERGDPNYTHIADVALKAHEAHPDRMRYVQVYDALEENLLPLQRTQSELISFNLLQEPQALGPATLSVAVDAAIEQGLKITRMPVLSWLPDKVMEVMGELKANKGPNGKPVGFDYFYLQP